ncbi:MAG: hypothetical protein HC783_18030 [Rhodobacteraceae bacterium]|nr:hypothetical protein [Paracoccaceae bacterium]
MLLIVNAGSSSLKLAVYDGPDPVAREAEEEIGSDGHAAALDGALRRTGIPASALQGAAHRVVHGGPRLTAACRITSEVHAEINAAVPLAPLHNPAALVGIQAVVRLLPNLPQYAAFDTAFHATNPEVATAYALPLAERVNDAARLVIAPVLDEAARRVLEHRAPMACR